MERSNSERLHHSVNRSAMDKMHRDSRKVYVSSQYFINFGVMGIFMPYFNLYCYGLGFTGFQIGTLSAVRSVAMVLFSPLWGTLADRLKIRRPIYIACTMVSTAIWLFYMFTTDFWPMLAVTAGFAIFRAPIISFLEAFTMDVLEGEKKSYGKIRVWGSISFISSVLLLGPIIDLYSIEIILILVFFGLLLQSAVAIKIPDIRIEKDESPAHRENRFFTGRLAGFLFAAFLMLMSHGAYYGFFSIHLENLGYEKTFIGFSWALASGSEILVMIGSDKLFKRYRIENILVFSIIVAAIRWFALFFAFSLPAILLLQLLHAVTYGAFHIASILYIDILTPDTAKTLGQAINNASSYGLGLMVGFLINGYLYENIGAHSLFAMSGCIALAGAVVLKGTQMVGNRTMPDNA